MFIFLQHSFNMMSFLITYKIAQYHQGISVLVSRSATCSALPLRLCFLLIEAWQMAKIRSKINAFSVGYRQIYILDEKRYSDGEDAGEPYVTCGEIPKYSKLSMLLDVFRGLCYLHCPPRSSVTLWQKISDLGVAKVIRAVSKKPKTYATGIVDIMGSEALAEIPEYGPASL